MSIQAASEEYAQALRQGQKEYNDLVAAGKDPNPAVLDEILPEIAARNVQYLGVMEIPAERIVGTRNAGRIMAFTPSFRPLLDARSEFANKWVSLCDAHLGDTGIREPIVCYEYLGNFYVQEGNKRVSVLRHFGAPRIPADVRRILPEPSEDPRVQAYFEFLEFYKITKLYTIQYRKPRDYEKLMSYLGIRPGDVWTETERRSFNTHFQYFKEAFQSLDTKKVDVQPEDALLLWLELHPFRELSTLSSAELKKALSAMWEDVLSIANKDAVIVKTETVEPAKPGILTRLVTPDHLNVAFIHQLSPATSIWSLGHERGKDYLAEVMGDKVTIRSYYNADSPELAAIRIEQAVADGAEVVFTTVPLMRSTVLRAAIRYPKVQFLNCSVDQPYASFRSYYGRVYEGKFITGAIAGALAQNNRIGYIASYPIFGETASINAFALGAQLTNPRAQIELRWSCMAGNPQADFFEEGIRVISNRDAPGQSGNGLSFCSYGTYLLDEQAELIPLASPVWVWGKFYELVLRQMFAGSWKNEKSGYDALNYWLGIDSGVIEVSFSEKLPEGVRTLASMLQKGLRERAVDPFLRRILAQDGSVKNDGTAPFTPDQLLHMDWLCENVVGSIPAFEELLPVSQPMVRELGLYREKIPAVKEINPREDTDHIR